MSRDCLWSLAKYSFLGAAAYGLLYSVVDYAHRLPISCLPWSEPEEDHHHLDRLAVISMIKELEVNPGVNFVGALRIPRANDEGKKAVDLVILTGRKLYLVEVKSSSNKIKRDADGSWYEKYEDGSSIKHGNVIQDVKERVALLESYLVRRGFKLPSEFIHSAVVFSNPECRVDECILRIPGVFSSTQWKSLLSKKAQKHKLGWMSPHKRHLLTMSLYQQLFCILKTAPTWDRLTFEDGGIVLGDFQGFEGTSDDLEALKRVKRTHVDSINIQRRADNLNVFGYQVTTSVSAVLSYTLRDYRKILSRGEAKAITEEPKESITVKGSTELGFLLVGSSIPKRFKLINLVSVQLSP
ncbi:hypothetical protein KP509_27G009000 [Ceratopteris richardii]|uniref:NERD domain-containing protein n=1 Tax=Ceratopteris richardii TaxID=49495 RepID=A0A8T2RDV9_CERRI|nr:hypothetical protein KP509_27G009000 [Ceratopteris richardii]